MALFDQGIGRAVAGIGTGGLSELMRPKAGVDAGNVFANPEQQAKSNSAIGAALGYQGSQDALNPIQSSRTATNEVGNNQILGQLFGQGGQLSQATAEESDLAHQGYALQPQDYTAYGQASGDLARQFGQNDQSLASALADRGLSNSGAAGAAFTSSLGNKNEQLAGLQRQIADNRMQMNLQRLGQTRNYISQLGSQGENAIQQQYGRQLGSEQQNYGETMGKANLGMDYLSGGQSQANNNLSQRSATASGGFEGALSQGLASGVQAAPSALIGAASKGAKAGA